MKVLKNLQETTNTTVYKHYRNELVLGCSRCPPHRGCNRFYRGDRQNSWKKFRKSQWKEVKDVN